MPVTQHWWEKKDFKNSLASQLSQNDKLPVQLKDPFPRQGIAQQTPEKASICTPNRHHMHSPQHPSKHIIDNTHSTYHSLRSPVQAAKPF